jgi:hypothetical protein
MRLTVVLAYLGIATLLATRAVALSFKPVWVVVVGALVWPLAIVAEGVRRMWEELR